MTCAAAAMIGGTGCSDFGDVNMDPEHLNSENIPTELLFTNGQHQMLGSDWDVWRNGCIYAAQWMSHTASFNWLGNANYTWNDGYSGAYWEIYNGDTRGALRDMKMRWRLGKRIRHGRPITKSPVSCSPTACTA